MIVKIKNHMFSFEEASGSLAEKIGNVYFSYLNHFEISPTDNIFCKSFYQQNVTFSEIKFLERNFK